METRPAIASERLSLWLALLLGACSFGCSGATSAGPGGSGGAGGTAGVGEGGTGGSVGTGGGAGVGGGGGAGGVGGAGGEAGTGGEGGMSSGTPEKSIPVVCDSSWSGPFATSLELVVTAPSIRSLEEFTADIDAQLEVPKDVLQKELINAFPNEMRNVEITAAQAEVTTTGVSAGSPATTELDTLPAMVLIPQVPNPGDSGGGTCVEDEDCPLSEFGQTCEPGGQCACVCQPGCTPATCANVVTENITVALGSATQAVYRAQPGGLACFDVAGDIRSAYASAELRTGVRLVTPVRERAIECEGGTLNDNGTEFTFDDFADANPVQNQLCMPIDCPNPPCNLCPVISTFTGAPREIVVSSSVRPYPRIELAFRAEDPDETCGDACSPEGPAAPGPGLVCTVLAVGIFGPPEGQFFDPLDPSAPLGPFLTVNLSTLDPGGVLPGLGGTQGASLPPLDYECPPGGFYDVTLSLSCGDGDELCDQRHELIVTCLHGDWCISTPLDCSAANDCVTGGFCDNGCPPPCDPSIEGYEPAGCDLVTGVSGSGTCTVCLGKDNPLPVGTLCSSNGGTSCDGMGNCL